MSDCKLVEDKHPLVDGITLFSEGSACMKPTSVYLPPKNDFDNKDLNVLLWLHGFYIKDNHYLFNSDKTKVRQAVNEAKKDFVVIAPFLGDGPGGAYGAGQLGEGTGCQRYLVQILEALGRWRKTRLATTSDSDFHDFYTIKNLVIGSHSAGGGVMRNAVGALGTFKKSLRECWGFDCLYGSARTWATWCRSLPSVKLYFYFGTGTSPGSGADVVGFWKLAYGTPQFPMQGGGHMQNVYLAPALPGVEIDRTAFQSVAQIEMKGSPTIPYEIMRKTNDQLLDDPEKYWANLRHYLKGHWAVAADLLGPRIRQSRSF